MGCPFIQKLSDHLKSSLQLFPLEVINRVWASFKKYHIHLKLDPCQIVENDFFTVDCVFFGQRKTQIYLDDWGDYWNPAVDLYSFNFILKIESGLWSTLDSVTVSLLYNWQIESDESQ